MDTRWLSPITSINSRLHDVVCGVVCTCAQELAALRGGSSSSVPGAQDAEDRAIESALSI